MNKQYFAVSQRRSLDHGMFFIIDHQFRWSCVVSFVILLPYRPQLLEYTPQSNRDLYRILCCVMSQQQQQQPPPEAKSLAKFSDGISALEYYLSEESTSSHIAATSWDGTLRIHDTATQTALATQSMECGPLLSLAIPSPTSLVVGSLDGSSK